MNRSDVALPAGAFAFAVCMAVLYATPRNSFWIVDCGNKALVATRLLETRFGALNFEYPGISTDPEAVAFPIRGYATPREDGFVSIYPPAYSALAVPFLALLGPPGLRVPAALGVAACVSLFVVWTAPALGRRRALLGALVLGLATPLFFYGITVWEHSITVALCLAAVSVLSAPTGRRLAAAGFLIGTACWFREELVLMAATLACACLLVWRRPFALLPLAAGTAFPLAGLAAFNQAAFGDPLGPHVAQNVHLEMTASELGPERVAQMLRQVVALFGGYGATFGQAAVLALPTLASAVLGWIVCVRNRAAPAAAWLVVILGLAPWLFAFATIAAATRPLFPLVMYNGLMITLPMFCLSGIGLARLRRDPETARLRVGFAAGLLFLLCMPLGGVAIQDVFGLGVHWGPRMLLPALPAVVGLAVVAARQPTEGGEREGFRLPRAAWGALIAAGLLSSVLSTWLLAQQKRDAEHLQQELLARPQSIVLTSHELLPQHLAWLWNRKQFLLVQSDETTRRIVRNMARQGIRDFLFIVPPGTLEIDRIPGVRCRHTSRHRGRHLHYLDVDIQTCEIRARS